MGFNNNRITQSKSIQGLKSVHNYAGALNDFENGFNSLVGYSDGTTRPTGTFGGSATNLVKSIVTTNPLVNSKSLGLSKTGACQGSGYYFDFTPNRADILSGSVMSIKFKLELITGTFSGSIDPSVDSDLIIGIWDTANSKIIEPSTRLLEQMVTGFVYEYKSEFQIPTNATTLKLFIHQAKTGASTFTIDIDGFEIAANQYNFGGQDTSWKSYTPIITGFGSVTTYNFKSRRVGDSLEVMGTFTADTPTATEARISLGYEGTDSNVTTISTLPTLARVGDFNRNNAASTFFSHGTVLIEASKSYMTLGLESSTTNGLTKRTGDTIVGAGEIVSLEGKFPIAGWSSSNQQSDSYSGRLINVIASDPTSSITGSATDITTWGTVSNDSAGSFNASTGVFTCKKSDVYTFSGSFLVAATLAAIDKFAEVDLVVNGSPVRSTQTRATINNSNIGLPYIFEYPLKAGDTAKLQITCSGTSPSFNAGSSWNYLQIHNLQSSATISATEFVGIRYSNTAGTSFSGTAANVPFVTKDYDTHGCWDGTDTFTAPTAGFYSVQSSINYGSVSYTAGHYVELSVFKGATKMAAETQGTAATATNFVGQTVSTVIYCLAGETILLKARNDASGSLVAAAGYNVITITRIK